MLKILFQCGQKISGAFNARSLWCIALTPTLQPFKGVGGDRAVRHEHEALPLRGLDALDDSGVPLEQQQGAVVEHLQHVLLHRPQAGGCAVWGFELASGLDPAAPLETPKSSWGDQTLLPPLSILWSGSLTTSGGP